MAQRIVLGTAHSADPARRPARSPGRAMLGVLAAASLVAFTACGGSDDDAGGDPAPDDAGDEQTDEAGSDEVADAAFDPAAVQACLADAGFETQTSSDLLSEQQVADQLTLFGQTESLTFDASTNAFAGGLSFHETSAQATERGQQLADAAIAQRVIGNVVINISAGTEFEDALAAAETCLDE